jgi:energy-coupling factor transporter ATP-binding protein EcfA2
MVVLEKNIRTANDRPAGKIAFLFQTPEEGFFSPSVHDEVAFGYRSFHGDAGVTEAVAGALEAVGLDAGVFMQRNPFHLSQGEKRMVALASLLVLPAELYYLDEPTLFLDGRARAMLDAALHNLNSKGLTCMIASHESRFIQVSTQRQISLEK